MPNPFTRLDHALRKRPTRYEKDLSYLWSNVTTNAFVTNAVHTTDEDDDDASSIDSFSTTATIDDNPGPGRIIDKHVFQFYGRKVEKLLSRYAGSSTSSSSSGNACEDDDDTNSVDSFSTNATEDDIPGPGRTIDKHIYQRFGRKVENFAFRITFSSLSPADILRYFVQKNGSSFYGPGFLPDISIDSAMIFSPGDAIGDISTEVVSWNQPCVAGLKSLVKQSKSTSLYQSASALATLVLLSVSQPFIGNFYIAVARVDQIFQLERLLYRLDELDPEKIYFSCLLNLAHANLYVGESTSQDVTLLAKTLQENILNLYDTHWTDHHHILSASKAYLPFAKATSCIHRAFGALNHNITSYSIMESTYFLSIYLLRSIIDLYRQAIYLKDSTQRLVNMLMSTFVRWLDVVLASTFSSSDQVESQELQLIQLIITLQSPFYVIGDTQFRSLFPNIFGRIQNHPVITATILPRKIRESVIRQGSNPLILQSYIRASTMRSQRLLLFPSELEREIRDRFLQFRHTLQLSMPPKREVFDIQRVRRSFYGARRATARMTSVTREFREARGDFSSIDEGPQMQLWATYKGRCRMRHTWGEFTRSDMDWDWDPSGSLKLLFGHRDEL